MSAPSENTASAPLDASRQNFWSRWLGIYISPAATFEEIARNPDFIYPLIAAIVAALALTETMLNQIGMERIIRNSLEQSGRASSMSAEQMEQAIRGGSTVGTVLSHVGAILGPPIFLVIVAGLGLAIVNGILGGDINFPQSLSVACYANLVTVLSVVMGLPMIFLGDPERFNPNAPSPTNLGFFLNPIETSKVFMAFASSIDIFSFWLIALLGIGYSAAARGKVKALSVGGAFFGLWLVIVLGKIALALIF